MPSSGSPRWRRSVSSFWRVTTSATKSTRKKPGPTSEILEALSPKTPWACAADFCPPQKFVYAKGGIDAPLLGIPQLFVLGWRSARRRLLVRSGAFLTRRRPFFTRRWRSSPGVTLSGRLCAPLEANLRIRSRWG